MDGAEVYERVRAEIERRLAAANVRGNPGHPFKPRTLRLGDVVACIRDVAEGRPLSLRHGGGSRTPSARTTFALAARVGSRVFLGISATWAWHVDPSRAFPQLDPWWSDNPITKHSIPVPPPEAPEKWTVWSHDPQILGLDDPEVDAILEFHDATDEDRPAP